MRTLQHEPPIHVLYTRTQPDALTRGRIMARPGLQLALYIAVGIVLPILAWYGWRPAALYSPIARTTAIAALSACLVSWYVLDRLRQYAKARRLSYVLPVNFLAFAAAAGVIGVLRAPYSVTLFASAFGATLVTSYLLTALTRFGSQPQYIVPGGKIRELKPRKHHMALATPADLDALVARGKGKGSVVADLHHDHSPEWERLLAKAAIAGIAVYHYRLILEMETGQVRIDHLSENNLGSLIPNMPYMAFKRFVDITGSLLLMPILIPVMLTIALIIRLDSPGRVFYVQERLGFRGKPFRMVKFRSMRDRTVADTQDARRNDAMTKDDDDRITRIGRFIRKVRLDELPQVFNILRGDMSWIGPRPEALSLSEWYEKEIPFYAYRHIVRPGITGWAQVNQGHVTDLNAINSKLRYDFYYVKNLSMWLDLLVALKTIRVVSGGVGAR